MNRTYRTAALVLCTLTILATVADLAQSQQRRRRWRFLGDNYSVGVALLQEEKVQAELKLSSEQIEKATEIGDKLSAERRELYSGLSRDEWRERGDELRKKTTELAKVAATSIAESMDEAQMKRWLQVSLQVRGPAALPGEHLAEHLHLGDEQVTKLDDLTSGQRNKVFEMFRQSQDQGLSREERMEKVNAIVKQTNESRMAVLTDEQKTAFEEMQGEKFELPKD